MSIHLRRTLALLSLAGLVIAVGIVGPVGIVEACLDWCSVVNGRPRFLDEVRREEELDRLNRIILERIEKKEVLLQDVVAGRRTLLETAAGFREADRTPADFPCAGPITFPGRSEEERYCRQVLQWVWIHTEKWPNSQAESLLRRLRAELDGHLASHEGRVMFPEH